jgi:hypothetical protein
MWNHNFLLKLSIIHKGFQFYCNLYIICVNNFILSPICYSINYLQSFYFNLRFILTSPPSFALLTNERVINQSINHLYSHKPYTTVQRRHKYTYNKYRISINIYTVYTTKTWVWDSLENKRFIHITYKFA